MKDTVMKNVKVKTQNWIKLGSLGTLESGQNSAMHYGKPNNLVLLEILEIVQDEELKYITIKILRYKCIEVCQYRFSNADQQKLKNNCTVCKLQEGKEILY